MKDASEGRRIFIWRGPEDTNRFASAIAEKLVAELFTIDGSLFWFDAGGAIPVNKNVLHEIVTKHFVSIRLVNRGGDIGEREFYSFEFPVTADTSKEPNERTLINLISVLVGLVARGPRTARKLSEQQQREVHARLKMGESQVRIADAYKVDVELIRQLAR